MIDALRHFEQSPLPQTLGDARIAVRNLPGAEHYIKKDALSAREIDRGIDRLVQETLDHLDAENMLTLLTYDLGWSQAEATTFFSHPQRRPFQSRLELPADPTERIDTYLTIGTYLRLRYQDSQARLNSTDSPTDEVKSAANHDKQTFRQFYDFTLDSLFRQANYDFQDRASGINPADRKAGTIKPDEELLSTFKTHAERVAAERGTDVDALYEQALSATEGGNTVLVFVFLTNNKGDKALREVFQGVIEQRLSRREIQIEKMQLLWQAHAFSLAMGMDWETLLATSGLPSSNIITDRLISFLTNPEYVAETERYLDEEAHEVYVNRSPGEPMNYWDILTARAKHHNLPDTVSTAEELDAKTARVYDRLRHLLPIGFAESPINHIFTPTRLGSTVRPSNTTYNNEQHEVVNIVILNPREREKDFEANTGHEAAHKIHAYMLDVGEKVGYLPEGINEKLSATVKEEFSQLVEGQINAIRDEDTVQVAAQAEQPAQEKLHGEFGDLYNALIKRRQAPLALIQQEVRLQMEAMQLGEYTGWDLPVEAAGQLIDRIQLLVEEWYQTGVPVYRPDHKVHSDVDIVVPTDGLAYVTQRIIGSKPQQSQGEQEVHQQTEQEEQQPIRMRDAFEQRFGKKWLLDQNARVVLLSLMADSGLNQNIITYGDYVLNADVEALFDSLQSWGIGPEQI